MTTVENEQEFPIIIDPSPSGVVLTTPPPPNVDGSGVWYTQPQCEIIEIEDPRNLSEEEIVQLSKMVNPKTGEVTYIKTKPPSSNSPSDQ